MFTTFTTIIARNGVRVSPDPRKRRVHREHRAAERSGNREHPQVGLRDRRRRRLSPIQPISSTMPACIKTSDPNPAARPSHTPCPSARLANGSSLAPVARETSAITPVATAPCRMLKNQPTYPPSPIASSTATRSTPSAIRPEIKQIRQAHEKRQHLLQQRPQRQASTCRGSERPASLPPNRTSAARWLASTLANQFLQLARSGFDMMISCVMAGT
jgi:hypothetical protein